MNLTCHRCEKQCPREEGGYMMVWEGVIDARQVSKFHCSGCRSAIKQSSSNNSEWEFEGEDWQSDYDPDDERSDDWKSSDE